jgi:hypothetical protein
VFLIVLVVLDLSTLGSHVFFVLDLSTFGSHIWSSMPTAMTIYWNPHFPIAFVLVRSRDAKDTLLPRSGTLQLASFVS